MVAPYPQRTKCLLELLDYGAVALGSSAVCELASESVDCWEIDDESIGTLNAVGPLAPAKTNGGFSMSKMSHASSIRRLRGAGKWIGGLGVSWIARSAAAQTGRATPACSIAAATLHRQPQRRAMEPR